MKLSLHRNDLRRIADPRSFERGETYFKGREDLRGGPGEDILIVEQLKAWLA